MTEMFRVPKRQVPAQVLIPGRPPMSMTLFLSECAGTHAGTERPSDLMNGEQVFFPATDLQGSTVFLRRDAVMVLTVASVHELGDDPDAVSPLASDEATQARLEVLLEDGSILRGVLRFLMPEGKRRLQDFLNLSDRFLHLEEGDRIHLINKQRIIRLTPL
jgi:hypothetical protein